MRGSFPKLRWLAAMLLFLLPVAAWAHPAPFSYLDVDMQDDHIEGRLTIHVIDAAHELGVPDPDHLLHDEGITGHGTRIMEILEPRLHLAAGGTQLKLEWLGAVSLEEQDAWQLSYRIEGAPPGALDIDADLFPYDPQHQTFVNVYENGELGRQYIFSADSDPKTYYAGSASGAWSVIQVFVPSGMHHILIGPDHLLFLFALLLLGGGWRQLVKIVTAFTVGHTVTLTLATLDIVTVPGWIVEPAIALSIVVVGADNLLRGEGRDLRAWVALVFGLVHGFGFASVLKDFGLPQEALGWSLFSFNVGVELGQLVVVIPVALLLGAIRKRSPELGKRVVTIGSIAVIGAGTFWFVQRVFFMGANA
jgi:hydrogenase/urease accessory protein HupE